MQITEYFEEFEKETFHGSTLLKKTLQYIKIFYPFFQNIPFAGEKKRKFFEISNTRK